MTRAPTTAAGPQPGRRRFRGRPGARAHEEEGYIRVCGGSTGHAKKNLTRGREHHLTGEEHRGDLGTGREHGRHTAWAAFFTASANGIGGGGGRRDIIFIIPRGERLFPGEKSETAKLRNEGTGYAGQGSEPPGCTITRRFPSHVSLGGRRPLCFLTAVFTMLSSTLMSFDFPRWNTQGGGGAVAVQSLGMIPRSTCPGWSGAAPRF